MTAFKPETHGFKFVNNFTVQTQFGGFNGPTFGGLCGGMVYAALDYFHAGLKIPQQDYLPAEGTTLQCYIWGRQQNSFFPNTLDKIRVWLRINGVKTLKLEMKGTPLMRFTGDQKTWSADFNKP